MRVLALLIVLGCVAALAQAQQPVTKSPSGKEPTSQASGVLRITSDPASRLSNEDLIARLAMSPTIYREAIANVSQEAAKAPLDEMATIAAFSSPPSTPGVKAPEPSDLSTGVGLVWVNVASYDEHLDAKKLLAQIGAALENVLRNQDTGHAAQQQRLANEERRVHELAERLEKDQQKLAVLASIHKVEVDPAVGAQKRLHIESELQSLNVQLEGFKARRQIIEAQIGKLSEKVSQSPANKAAEKALEARLALQQAILNRMTESNQKFAGTILQADMQVAQVRVLEAEAELAKLRAQSAQEAGGGRIALLASRLDDTAIEIAETEVRRAALKELSDAATQSSQVEMTRIQVQLLEGQYRRAVDELSRMRNELQRYVPPSVTVIWLD
jgi:hypothetical protein